MSNPERSAQRKLTAPIADTLVRPRWRRPMAGFRTMSTKFQSKTHPSVESEWLRLLEDRRAASSGWVSQPLGRTAPSRPGLVRRSGSLQIDNDRLRVTMRGFDLVAIGNKWWMRTGIHGSIKGRGATMILGQLELLRLAHLLDPALLIESARHAARVEFDGRQVTMLRTTSEVEPGIWFPGQGWGGLSTQFAFVFDQDMKVGLGLIEFFGKRVIRQIGLERAEFNQQILPGVFDVHGKFESFRRVAPRQMRLADALKLLKFALVVPTYNPVSIGSWDGGLLVDAGGDWAVMSYEDAKLTPQSRLSIVQSNETITDSELISFETIVFGHQTMFLQANPSRWGDGFRVLTIVAGTKIIIDALLPRDDVVRVAASLEPIDRQVPVP